MSDVINEVEAEVKKVEAVTHRYLDRMTSRFHSLRGASKSLPVFDGPLPPAADLRPKLLAVKDQDVPVGEGDCTGQGTSCIVELNTGSAVWLSAPFLYRGGRLAEGTFPDDSGCVIADVMSYANADGTCLDSLMPQTGDPAEVASDAAIADAPNHKIGSILMVDYSDDGTAFKTNIAAGKVIVVGFTVPANFETGIGTDGVMPTPDTSSSPGGHCVVVVGYETDAAGALWLWIRNSWGTGFGAGGYFKALFSDFAPLVSEAWTA